MKETYLCIRLDGRKGNYLKTIRYLWIQKQV